MDQRVSDNIERTLSAKRAAGLKRKIKRRDGLAIGKRGKQLGDDVI